MLLPERARRAICLRRGLTSAARHVRWSASPCEPAVGPPGKPLAAAVAAALGWVRFLAARPNSLGAHVAHSICEAGRAKGKVLSLRGSEASLGVICDRPVLKQLQQLPNQLRQPLKQLEQLLKKLEQLLQQLRQLLKHIQRLLKHLSQLLKQIQQLLEHLPQVQKQLLGVFGGSCL